MLILSRREAQSICYTYKWLESYFIKTWIFWDAHDTNLLPFISIIICHGTWASVARSPNSNFNHNWLKKTFNYFSDYSTHQLPWIFTMLLQVCWWVPKQGLRPSRKLQGTLPHNFRFGSLAHLSQKFRHCREQTRQICPCMLLHASLHVLNILCRCSTAFNKPGLSAM